MNRYDRQIRVSQIGKNGQHKINQSKILIVGCGALGSYAAEQLTRAGVDTLILIDPDIVELSNLQRQTLFTTNDAKKKAPKVVAAKEQLQRINPNVTITCYQQSFDSAVFQDFGPLDLVLDCTDNFLVRQMINDFCIEYHLPFIFASCASTSGQVMAIYADKGPCLQCVFPHLLQLQEKGCETLGIFTPLIPLVSGLQISLALQYLVQAEKMDWQTLHIIESWPISSYTIHILKQDHCPSCSIQKKGEDLNIKETCGKVFQIHLKENTFSSLEQFIIQHKYPYQKNTLALKWHTPDGEITYFKNGQCLFYNYKKENVKRFITSLKPFLHP